MYSIYALGDPRTQEVCYVGIAIDVFRRYAQHLNSPHNNLVKNAWVDNLKASDLLPTLSVLEKVKSEETARDKEMQWIAHYLAIGEPLTNVAIPMEMEHRNMPLYIRDDEALKQGVNARREALEAKMTCYSPTKGNARKIKAAQAKLVKQGVKPTKTAIAQLTGLSRTTVTEHFKKMAIAEEV